MEWCRKMNKFQGSGVRCQGSGVRFQAGRSPIYGLKTCYGGVQPAYMALGCEGVKQICRKWVNKKIFFTPQNVKMTFTPSQPGRRGESLSPLRAKNWHFLTFFDQKMRFVMLSESLFIAVML